ncbi:hypothetical protein D3C86_1068390 [compost metagenome]|jgi:hypothetical protein
MRFCIQFSISTIAISFAASSALTAPARDVRPVSEQVSHGGASKIPIWSEDMGNLVAATTTKRRS